MKNEFLRQYGHTWRVFERIVKDFEANAWLRTGRGCITPARLAFHVLHAVKYYLEDTATAQFASGKSFETKWESAPERQLPSQTDIIVCIGEFREKAEKWLTEMDYGAENKTFPWAGDTRLDVALFLLRHTLFHIGELSSLLNESREGVVEDHYVKAI